MHMCLLLRMMGDRLVVAGRVRHLWKVRNSVVVDLWVLSEGPSGGVALGCAPYRDGAVPGVAARGPELEFTV